MHQVMDLELRAEKGDDSTRINTGVSWHTIGVK